MAEQIPVTQISTSALDEILKWKKQFDPPPEWFQFNQEQLREFARLQVALRIKELEIEKEKLTAISEIMGKR